MNRTRTFPRGGIRFLALLTFLALCVAPAGSALAQPPTPFTKLFDTLWYLRSIAEVDVLTSVYGGVEGSSALILRDYDNRKSHWTLLEGQELYLSSGAGGSKWVTTQVPGNYVTSEWGGTWNGAAPQESKKNQLSWVLVDLYLRSKAEGSSITHAPFLTGFGWTGGGASIADANSLCNSMDLVIVLETGSPVNGFVISQSPAGGALITGAIGSPAREVKVTLSGGVVIMPPILGDYWEDAILVGELGSDGTVNASGTLTLGYANNENPPTGIGDPNAPDIFFKLPASAKGRLVTVTEQKGNFDRLVLCAFKKPTSGPLEMIKWDGIKDAAVVGIRPSLVFVHPRTVDCYVMGELTGRKLGAVRLTFRW